MNRRVVITGMGTVNPLGNNVDKFWQGICNGESGVDKITRFDASNFTARIAGEVKEFDDSSILESRESRRMDDFTRYAIFAGMQAYEDAKLEESKVDSDRLGVILGVGFCGIDTLESEF